jgi:hypothetical protein
LDGFVVCLNEMSEFFGDQAASFIKLGIKDGLLVEKLLESP